MADLETVARSLQNDPDTAVNVPVVVTSGVIAAFIMLSFAYVWSLWISLGLIVLLGAVMAVSYTRRPPVAPPELIQRERGRVRRVLSEHGIRPVVTLVRVLCPEESPATVARAIELLPDQMLMKQGDQGRRG